ncbi:hypothetical protein STEG23_017442 [Scotinomys teguina]
MDKENLVYTMEYYAAEKNNDIMKFAGKWMELENVILSKVASLKSVIICQPFYQRCASTCRGLQLEAREVDES